MRVNYTEEQRIRIMQGLRGQTIRQVLWNEEERYWTMLFTDGTEISFQFM
jgi:hypothetical protein